MHHRYASMPFWQQPGNKDLPSCTRALCIPHHHCHRHQGQLLRLHEALVSTVYNITLIITIISNNSISCNGSSNSRTNKLAHQDLLLVITNIFATIIIFINYITGIIDDQNWLFYIYSINTIDIITSNLNIDNNTDTD